MAGTVRSLQVGPWNSRAALLRPVGVVGKADSIPVLRGGSPRDAGIVVVMVEAQDFPRQPDRTAQLHGFRTGFQTVGNFLNSAMAYKASRLVEAEQDNARRATPTYPAYTSAATAGLPLPLMLTSSLRILDEPQELRLSQTGPSIHLFRVGFQTVAGLTLAQLHKPSTRVDAESYEVRSPAPTLHFARVGSQTVGQPFAGNFKPALRLDAESYEVRSAPPYLHLFRVGYQTVGQPLGMRSSPRATRIEAEQDFVARKAQRYPSSNVLVGGMPLPLLAMRTPRNHALYDGAQFFGSLTDWESYQQAYNAPPVVPQYNPLFLMQRKPMAWAHHEPVLFFGALPDWEKINTPTTQINVAVYDFQFLIGVFEVHDLNGPEWQEQVRYHTNHGRLMQAFRQYQQINLTNLQFDADAHGTLKFCAEPEVWIGDGADPAPPWVGDAPAGGLWVPASATGGVWAPASPNSGAWAAPDAPTTAWDTQQKAC